MSTDHRDRAEVSSPRSRRRVYSAWVLFLGTAVILMLMATRYRMILVVGDSMHPTFRTGDLVWVDRQAYDSVAPQESDVVVARVQGQFVLKRIVGLPGQDVEVRDGVVFLDDQPRPLPHPATRTGLDVERGVLGKDKYAILGDNRAQTSHPTLHAVIPKQAIVGRVVGHLSLRP